jgi:phage-related minor tail protein
MRGARKLLFGLLGLAFLAGAFAACIAWPAAAVVFPPYATAVVAVVTVVVAGNAATHAAQAKAAVAGGISDEEFKRRLALAAGRTGGAA